MIATLRATASTAVPTENITTLRWVAARSAAARAWSLVGAMRAPVARGLTIVIALCGALAVAITRHIGT